MAISAPQQSAANPSPSDHDRVEFLFALYEKLTSPPPAFGASETQTFRESDI
jgi:hypothetical protein